MMGKSGPVGILVYGPSRIIHLTIRLSIREQYELVDLTTPRGPRRSAANDCFLASRLTLIGAGFKEKAHAVGTGRNFGDDMTKHENPARFFGVARVLSKQGVASRSQAAVWVREGRIRVNGHIVRDPEFRVLVRRDLVTVDGVEKASVAPVYVLLNKPRGLVTTVSDEKSRGTVYQCFGVGELPWMAPVGRLDKASEGALLFSNDTAWAAGITAPESQIDKTYCVHIDRLINPADLEAMRRGISFDGELHAMKLVTVLREGGKNSWLEIVLDEGKNRQIRKILAGMDITVLRLIRVGIGSVELGHLAKGQWRHLDNDEVSRLRRR
jgi:23S rRNA pseudouridine2605 synthase